MPVEILKLSPEYEMEKLRFGCRCVLGHARKTVLKRCRSF
jgi:hypothetical protein